MQKAEGLKAPAVAHYIAENGTLAPGSNRPGADEHSLASPAGDHHRTGDTHENNDVTIAGEGHGRVVRSKVGRNLLHHKMCDRLYLPVGRFHEAFALLLEPLPPNEPDSISGFVYQVD